MVIWRQFEFNVQNFQFQEISAKMVQDMKDRLDLLAEFEGHQLDERLIAHLIKHHCISYTKCDSEDS